MPRAVTFSAQPRRSNPAYGRSSTINYPPLSKLLVTSTNPISPPPAPPSNPAPATRRKLRFPVITTPLDPEAITAPSLKPSLQVLVSRCLPPPPVEPSSASSSSSSTPTYNHPHPHSLTSDLSNSRSSNPSPHEIRQAEQAAERVRAEKAAKRAAALAVPKGKGIKRSSSAASTGKKAIHIPTSPTLPLNTHSTRSRATSPVASEPSTLGARAGLKRTRSTQGITIPVVSATNPPTPSSPIANSPLRRAATLSPPAAQTDKLEPTPSTFPLRHAKPQGIEMRRVSSGPERVRRETTLPRNLREYETRVGAMS